MTRYNSSASLPSLGRGVKGWWNTPHRPESLPDYQNRFTRDGI